MDRVFSMFGRLARRQLEGLPIELPDLTLPIPLPTGSSEVTTSTASATSSTSSSAPTTSIVPTTSSTPTLPVQTITTSATSTAPRSTITSIATTTTAERETILIQTTPSTTTSASLEDEITSVVFENRTVTRSVSASSTGSAIPTQVGGAKSFLDNKVASGVVFGICGLAGLALILLIVWFALRKSRRVKKLEDEVISFDPEDIGRYHHRPTDVESASKPLDEKARSTSSLDQYAGTGYAPTMNAVDNDYGRNAAPYSDYAVAPHQVVQRPGNAAFNPMGSSVDLNYSRSTRSNQYQPYRGY